MFRILKILFRLGLFVGVLCIMVAIGAVMFAWHKYGRDLPSYDHLANYTPPTITRLYADDGRLMAEYATQRRLFIPISAIPEQVTAAFLSAEDKRFYEHGGIDYESLVGAVINNIQRYLQGRSLVGASTITQQVAKNFVVGNDRTAERKIREAFLAIQIERDFTKDQIIELYLNEIFFGLRAHGIAQAAQIYFDKSVDELKLHEAAYLASLPKAPNRYHPIQHKERALSRRNWVLERMALDGNATRQDVELAKKQPLPTTFGKGVATLKADYFSEEVRKQLVELYGIKTVNEGGLTVRTTMNPRLQVIAQQSLRDGLAAYDKRHGFRGPLGKLDITSPDFLKNLTDFESPPGLRDWTIAAVTETGKDAAIILADGSSGVIPFAELSWGRKTLKDQKLGPKINGAKDILSPGDIVAVERLGEGQFALRQIPNVNGAIVALDPHTGRVLAMVGGWDFEESEFNRATQAKRQPGSTIKPFVYLAALDRGFTPQTIVLDAPVVIEQIQQDDDWRPRNADGQFLGPIALERSLILSRNLATVRVADAVGMETVTRYIENFGIADKVSPVLSMALGSGETTLMRMTRAYAMLVNEGKVVNTSLVDRIQDRRGKTLYKHDKRLCDACDQQIWQTQNMPELIKREEIIADPISVYQLNAMLQGVVDRGTARKLKKSFNGRPVAGKTGTTNDTQDAWFVGFTPDMVVGVYIGFDTPRTLGKREYGGEVAGPVFRDFLVRALKDEPVQDFRIPKGIVFTGVDPETGLPSLFNQNAGQNNGIGLRETPITIDENLDILPQDTLFYNQEGGITGGSSQDPLGGVY